MTTSHSLTKDQHVWTFDANMKPVIEVMPGDSVDIETWDCFTGQVQSEADTVETLDLTRINSATGPIAIVGSEPGDVISVTFNDITPNTQGAAMVIPEWGQLIEHCKAPVTRIFKVENGIVKMNDKVSFPSKPMFGVIGVAPSSGSIQTFDAGPHGGNMYDHLHGKGCTVYLPVFQSGAQLAIGDMHASMGDGEISGTGVEIGGKANLTLGLKKKTKIGFPVSENQDSWFAHGSTANNIDDALKIACEEAARLLVDQWGFTMEDAFIFLSVAGDLGIAAYYHPSPGCVTARMRVPKISACPRPFK